MDKAELHKIQSQVDAYRAGRLSHEEIDLLWEELIEYPEMMEYLINSVNLEAISAEEIQKYEHLAERKRTGPAKVTVLSRFTQNWSRIAAVFLVGMGLLSTAYFWGSDYILEPEPIVQIELDSYRSSNIPTAVFDYELQRAINLASMEQFDQAIEMLEGMKNESLTTEQQISLMINKGSFYFNKGDFTSAGQVFHEILDSYDELHVLTEEQVHWFLGNTYLQLGKEDLALVHIQKTYDLNGAYRRLAERFLD